MSYPQQPQYGTPMPQKKSNPKLVIGIIVAAFLIPVLILVGFFVVIKSQQSKYIEKTEQYKIWDVNGGYANNTSEIDPGLQERLETQEALESTLDSQYGIEGYFNKTNVTQLNISDQPRDEITGEPTPESTAAVDLDAYYYLDGGSNLEETVATVEELLKDQGYTTKLMKLSSTYIYVEATRPATSNATGTDIYDEEIRVDFIVPSSLTPYLVVKVLDNTDYHLVYQLSGIPIWSGFIDSAKFEDDGQYSWVDDSFVPADEVCALEENAYYGYWDAKYDCLETEAVDR